MPADDTKRKGPGGRPTDYRPEFAEQAHRLSLLGLTDAEMAPLFDVSVKTFNTWKRAHPEFLQSIREGKTPADARVAMGLYERACGCSRPEFRVSVVDGQVVITETIKHFPPDPAAASLWLRNRQPALWRDKVEIQQDTNLHVFPAKEQLDAIYLAAMARATERAKMLEGRRERLGCIDSAERDTD